MRLRDLNSRAVRYLLMSALWPRVLIAVVAEYAGWPPELIELWDGDFSAAERPARAICLDPRRLRAFYCTNARAGDLGCLRAIWARRWTAKSATGSPEPLEPDHLVALGQAVAYNKIDAAEAIAMQTGHGLAAVLGYAIDCDNKKLTKALDDRGVTTDAALLAAVKCECPRVVRKLLLRDDLRDCKEASDWAANRWPDGGPIRRALAEHADKVERGRDPTTLRWCQDGLALLKAAWVGTHNNARDLLWLHARWRHVTDELVQAVEYANPAAATRLRALPRRSDTRPSARQWRAFDYVATNSGFPCVGVSALLYEHKKAQSST